MPIRRFFLLLALLPCIVPATPSYAWLKICNRTPEITNVAIAYQSQGLWQVKGWWALKPRDCACVTSDTPLDSTYYYYAYSAAHEWAGSTSFCIDISDSFTISSRDTCAPPHFTRPFIRLDTRLKRTHTVRLTLRRDRMTRLEEMLQWIADWEMRFMPSG